MAMAVVYKLYYGRTILKEFNRYENDKYDKNKHKYYKPENDLTDSIKNKSLIHKLTSGISNNIKYYMSSGEITGDSINCNTNENFNNILNNGSVNGSINGSIGCSMDGATVDNINGIGGTNCSQNNNEDLDNLTSSNNSCENNEYEEEKNEIFNDNIQNYSQYVSSTSSENNIFIRSST
jgi:ABC-type transport system involved in Fe-S cluster assembly fused permease/ATPase subunit